MCLKNVLLTFCWWFKYGKDPDDLIRTMNEEMVKVVDWMQINRLSSNLNKTHFILYRRKRVRISLSTDLIINNVKIDMIERTKFLGVIIDQNLSFQSHINYIKVKVARGIDIFAFNFFWFLCTKNFNSWTSYQATESSSCATDIYKTIVKNN